MMSGDNSDKKSDESFWDKISKSANIPHIFDDSKKILDSQITHAKEIVKNGRESISDEVRNFKNHLPSIPDASVSVPFLWAGKMSREFSAQYPYIAGLCRRHPEVTVGAPSLIVAFPSFFGKTSNNNN